MWSILTSVDTFAVLITETFGNIGQYASEIALPTPEGTSNGLISLAGQISVVLVYAMEPLKTLTGSYTLPIFCFAVLLFVCIVLALGLIEPDKNEPYRVNVGGTRATLQAAMDMGITKVVYTSMNNAMGAHGPGAWNEETSEFNHWKTKDHYSISKYLAEIEAFKFGAKGLPVVIVSPTTVFGTNDRRPTSSGRLIIDVATRKVPAYFEGMTNIIDVDDVAYAQVAAMTKGRIGERYLLGNRNVTLTEFFTMIADIAGVKPPRLKFALPVALVLGWIWERKAAIDKKMPTATISEMKIGAMGECYDCSKAVRELGLPQTPAETTIRNALKWFRANGYVSASNRN